MNAGAAPSATTVPTATPLSRTPAKNVGWYASTAAPPSNTRPGGSRVDGPRTFDRPATHHATSASRAPPATTRINPTAVADAESGPYAWAVPVVAKHTAAAMTSRMGRTPYCYTILRMGQGASFGRPFLSPRDSALPTSGAIPGIGMSKPIV